MADTLPTGTRALTFQSFRFNVIDHDGQPWLTAADIARALGYLREDAISRLYQRNASEFTPEMTLTVKTTVKGPETVNLTVSGNLINEVRIFSLRGAHLLAMFARSQVAKEFRRWVLDVLEQTARTPSLSVEHALAGANLIAARVQVAAFNLLQQSRTLTHERWMLYFAPMPDGSMEPQVRRIDRDALVMSVATLARTIPDPALRLDNAELATLAAMFNLPDTGDIVNAEQARLAAQRIPSMALWKAVVILMMAEDQAPTYLMTKTDSDLKKEPPHFTAVAQMLGIDLKPIELEARATVKAEVNEEIKTLKAQIAPKPKSAPATTPAAGVDVSTGGKGAKAKKADAPLRKPKTSASEAQAQIAAAMQAEEKTDPGADAQDIEATASGFALAVGARVTILPSATGKKEARWIGKTGTVQRQVGPEAWDVCFTPMVAKPVTGKAAMEFQSFHVTELAVEAD